MCRPAQTIASLDKPSECENCCRHGAQVIEHVHRQEIEEFAARFIAIRSAVPELTRSAPIQLNKRFSLRRCAVTISLADDERSPLEFYLFGSLGCRDDVLDLVHVCLCRACFQALKRAQSDGSQPLYAAAADSNHTLAAFDRGFFLRRYCSGRRSGSHWLDCTGTARILGPRQLHQAFCRHVPRLIGARRIMLGLSEMSWPIQTISGFREIARACLSADGAQLRRIKEQVQEFDRLIRARHRSDEMSMRLNEAPGVGPVLATAVVATVADPKSFRSGRNFSV
jgi:hypothetical protein